MENARQTRKSPKTTGSLTRRSHRAKSKAPQRTFAHGGHGFLNSQFAPVMADSEGILKGSRNITEQFMQSLEHLCTLYKLPIPAIPSQPFPQNIMTAYTAIKQKLEIVAPSLELIILQKDSREICLTTIKSYTIGTTLYYLPVSPVVDMLNDPARQQEARLLLFVFAYLYHIVDMPWFLHCSSFLSHTYNMIESWVNDMDDPEEDKYREEMSQAFTRMHNGGDKLQDRLCSFKSLRGWRKAIKGFRPQTAAGRKLKKVVSRALQLYKSYPGRNLWNSIQPELIHPRNDDDRITLDTYFSFFWDDCIDLYDTLMDSVNTSLQEYYITDEPLSLQCFDKLHFTQSHSLDFEQQIFNLIDELCDVLTDLRNEKQKTEQ